MRIRYVKFIDGLELGGNRKTDNYMYRYFMEPKLSWWVGNNALITAAGIGLVKAAEIFSDDHLAQLAQRQPFNAHQHFDGSTFIPGTPVVPAAVLNGIGGDRDNMPHLKDGSWPTCEYWTPMVAIPCG